MVIIKSVHNYFHRCSCKYNNGECCSRLFHAEDMVNRRMQMAEMTNSKLMSFYEKFIFKHLI